MSKRVLLILEDDGFPADTRARNECRVLVEAGYRVTVIAPARRAEALSEVVGGAQVYRYHMPFRPTGRLGFALEYIYAMAVVFALAAFAFVRRGFDVIHLHNPPDTLILVALPYRLFGKKVVYDYNDTTPELFQARLGARGPIYRWLEIWVGLSCRFSNAVLTVNEVCKRRLCERFGISQGRVWLVRNGPNLRELNGVCPDDIPFSGPGTVLGYIGVLGPQEGVESLLNVLHRLRYASRSVALRCLIIGDGDALPTLKSRVRELHIEDAVSFTGRLPWRQAMEMLRQVDIGVDPAPDNPYNQQVSAMKVLEYMALGKPVVAYDLPGHRASAGGAALYARPGDEADFAEKVRLLLANSDLRASMGEEGRRRIKSDLAWEHSAASLLRAYSSLWPSGG